MRCTANNPDDLLCRCDECLLFYEAILFVGSCGRPFTEDDISQMVKKLKAGVSTIQ